MPCRTRQVQLFLCRFDTRILNGLCPDIYTVATAALKRKKMNEVELNRLGESRLHLEMQVNTLEAANMNAETMAAMKKAADALKVIHGNL